MTSTKKLTKLSLSLYSSFFPGFYLLELTLKNKLFHLLKEEISKDWFTEQLKMENEDTLFSAEREIILRRKPKNFTLTDNGLLLESGFGFWVEFFNNRVYKLSKGRPIKIFTQLPKGIKRKDIYERLVKLKEFRNRLYHSRIPLITEKAQAKCISEAQENYEMLLELLHWLDSPNYDLFDLSHFVKQVNQIKSLLELT
jgi:hypothetical protein